MPLRNSCEPCHISKLRCDRKKPICTRCATNGNKCFYAPTKRPGRPRKAPPPRLQGAGISPGGGEGVEATVTRSDDIVTVFDFADESIVQGPKVFSDSMLPVHYNSEGSVVSMPPDSTTMSQSASSDLQQQQPYWKVDAISLASDCESLRKWITTSPVLGPVMNTLPENTSGNREVCLCHTVMVSLLFHQRGARNIETHSQFEAYLYLQRILDWTWTTLKDCNSCRRDETLLFIVAATAKEVAHKHRAIIEDITQSLRQSLSSYWSAVSQAPDDSNTHIGEPSLIRSVPLTFGEDAVHKSVKTTFLCRLVRTKLQQLDALLSELAEAGAGRKVAGSTASLLHAYIADTQECIHTSASKLDTSD